MERGGQKAAALNGRLTEAVREEKMLTEPAVGRQQLRVVKEQTSSGLLHGNGVCLRGNVTTFKWGLN